MVHMITVEHLTKRYGSFTAVDDISFTLSPGTVTGFLGPNGAGKSTAMRVMTGLTPPTSGTATILGQPYAQLPNPGRQVGVLLDASAQHAGRTGREVLALGAKLMGLGKDRVDEILHLVGLTPDEARRRLRHYSLGMRQRLGVAHALLGDPEVLILDEPTSQLDPQGTRLVGEALRRLVRESRTAILVVEHKTALLDQLADRVVVIGRILTGPNGKRMH